MLTAPSYQPFSCCVLRELGNMLGLEFETFDTVPSEKSLLLWSGCCEKPSCENEVLLLNFGPGVSVSQEARRVAELLTCPQ